VLFIRSLHHRLPVEDRTKLMRMGEGEEIDEDGSERGETSCNRFGKL
jgi:hypothetical protein